MTSSAPTTDETLQRAIEREQIRQIEIRYVEAQDFGLWDDMALVLDDEVELKMGGNTHRVSRDQYVEMVRGGFGAIAPHESRHIIANQRTSFDGDVAVSTATSMAAIRGRIGGDELGGTLIARFNKTLRRRNGSWVISSVEMLDTWPTDAGGAKLLGALMGG